MRDLSDVHFPEAEWIMVVLDNLSTHTPAELCNALPVEEPRRVRRQIEVHYTPKYANWLNMIEIGVLQRQCVGRRIPDRETLETEIAGWEQQRNRGHARINRMFTTETARRKVAKAYPRPNLSHPQFKGSRSA